MSKSVGKQTRINRYIVECKCQVQLKPVQERTGINRYIVECKLKVNADNITSWVELIDT